jgi:hypothetical protein
LDERSGTVHINHHEGILEFFRWVIGANQWKKANSKQ